MRELTQLQEKRSVQLRYNEPTTYVALHPTLSEKSRHPGLLESQVSHNCGMCRFSRQAKLSCLGELTPHPESISQLTCWLGVGLIFINLYRFYPSKLSAGIKDNSRVLGLHADFKILALRAILLAAFCYIQTYSPFNQIIFHSQARFVNARLQYKFHRVVRHSYSLEASIILGKISAALPVIRQSHKRENAVVELLISSKFNPFSLA